VRFYWNGSAPKPLDPFSVKPELHGDRRSCHNDPGSIDYSSSHHRAPATTAATPGRQRRTGSLVPSSQGP